MIGLKSVICLESGDNFVLTVGVRERDTRRLTSYGATAESNCPVSTEDITVYYHRVRNKTVANREKTLTNFGRTNKGLSVINYWGQTQRTFPNIEC